MAVTPIPPDLLEKMKRGEAAMKKGAPKRNECLAHARGDQYKYVNSENELSAQAINTVAARDLPGKPRHRVRQTRNFIYDIVETETAASTQRIPSYDISPSGNEPRRISAARLSRRVALYGYDQWNLRRASERVIRMAVIADEGFAWPYFDNSIGPFLTDNDPEGNSFTVGQGDICVRTFGPNEVFWEAGLPFHESRWIGIKQARNPKDVEECEGFIGGPLSSDGQQAESSSEKSQAKLVLVTEYLERPSKANQKGRWLTMANDRVIVAERPYPCEDGEGNILDEPVLHKLTYSMDPDSDRDSGLVRHLIDAQRTVNHCNNKISEWINLALNPQLIVQNGELKNKLTDEPGAVYKAVGTGELIWRNVPPIPPELFKQKEDAVADMARIAAQNDIPSQVESGRGITALIEKDASRRANFLANLAEFHSRLMRHCLYLVQKHYSEPRLLKVRGEAGTEPIKDFLGSELLGEVDVRVDPGSLEPHTRENIEAKIMAFAERGWISPHAAMAAINNGTAESLVESYERDVARANLIIQKVKEGPEVLFATPPRRPFFGEEPGYEEVPNEETGEPEQVQREMVPGWMPRPFDDTKVQQDVLSDWMKSPDYDELDPPSQEALNSYYDAILQLEAKKQAQSAAAQEETAQALGMSNAARPSTPTPLPDMAPVGQPPPAQT